MEKIQKLENNPPEMDYNDKALILNRSISILVQAVELAQSKGVYTLSEAALIAEAVDFFDSINVANRDDENEGEGQ